MNIFHRYKNCTDRYCKVHALGRIGDGLAEVSKDIRELNSKYPIKPQTSIREDLHRAAQKAEGINETLGRITEGLSK